MRGQEETVMERKIARAIRDLCGDDRKWHVEGAADLLDFGPRIAGRLVAEALRPGRTAEQIVRLLAVVEELGSNPSQEVERGLRAIMAAGRGDVTTFAALMAKSAVRGPKVPPPT
jgi:hypothetical protein